MYAVDAIGSSGKVAGASGILDAGQRLIMRMRSTTGLGDPEDGRTFGEAAALFIGAGELLGSAYPDTDWQGAASAAYSQANQRQAGKTDSIAVLDRRVQTVIAREAYQVADRRGKLDEQSDYLAGFASATQSIGLIPGVGNALKAAFEIAAVNTALGSSSAELSQLCQETADNAGQLRDLAGEYAALIHKTAPPDVAQQPPVDQEPHDVREREDEPEAEKVPPTDDLVSPSARVPNGAETGAPPALPPVPEPVGRTLEGTADATGAHDAMPADTADPTAMPSDAMSGMASAFGVVGGMIGAVVTPLAAVLTGVAGAAAQSMGALGSPGAADSAAIQPEPARSNDHDVASDTSDDGGRVPDDAGEEAVDSEGTEPVAVGGGDADSEEQPARPTDKLEPDPPAAAPPAPTRPPR